MKMYIKSSTTINDKAIQEAARFANQFKHSIVDLQNHSIIVPLNRNTNEQDLMNPKGGWGSYLEDLGFTITFKHGDFEYQTQSYRATGSISRIHDGHTSYLRNRLIMTITW